MKIMMTFALAFAVALSAAAGDIPSRLGRAKAGEWVEMRNTAGDNAGEKVRISVAEVKGEGDDAVVVLKMEPSEGESRTIELPIARHKARMADLEEKAKQVSRERLTVKGKEISVYAVVWDDEENNREFKLWLSEDIPVGGIVKSWSSDPDVPAGEVVDFGF